MFKVLMICAVLGFAAAVHPVHPAPHAHVEKGAHSGSEQHHGGRSDDVHADVLSLKSDVRADGFDHNLETSNHISQSASGDEHGNIHGTFGWISPEGEHIDITYTADEHGYQPSGASVPAIPDYIKRAIEWNEAHPHAPESHNHHH